ncbi:DeoR family transcriptional regulator, partial [Candidatus Parcubacteria bacterium]|nr:DeoR family transcriptional regulator [Candidatus Parcubacteria bacterium]
ILNLLIEEYLDASEPISSGLLKKKSNLSVSGATIRNDLQELTEQGYVIQPHTSAGRIPTDKGYRYFVDIVITRQEAPDFISREIEIARQKIEKELQIAQSLIKSLTEIADTLNDAKLHDKDNTYEILKIIGSGRSSYDKNISLLSQLMEELENL